MASRKWWFFVTRSAAYSRYVSTGSAKSRHLQTARTERRSALVNPALSLQEVAVARLIDGRGLLGLFGHGLVALDRPARLAFGLERFPDHRRQRIVGRPCPEHRLAAAAIDADHADARRRAERQIGRASCRESVGQYV